MKKIFSDIRRQNTPDLSLDREILEKAKKLRAGKKTMLSEERKEQNGMKISMNKAESSETAIVKKNHGAVIAAAAAAVMIVGGAAATIMNGRMPIENVGSPVSATESGSYETYTSIQENKPEDCITPDTDSSQAYTTATALLPETPTDITTGMDTGSEPPSTDPVAEWAKPYLANNSDVVGYIHIPGFDNEEYYRIDQPVVQRDGDDWTYYRAHNWEGVYYNRGAIVAPNPNGSNKIGGGKQPDNTVIYGYNAFDEFPESGDEYDEPERGLMFTGLKLYQKGIDFYKEHAIIDFKSIYEDSGEYVIFAVFNHDSKTESCFMNTSDFSVGGSSFESWLGSVERASYYKCDINCTAEDKYITLVTPTHPNDDPDYYRTIIAKKLTDKDDRQAIINSVRTAREENENGSAPKEDPVELTMQIPVPDSLKGSYTFDIYRDGTLSYTKTVADFETLSGNTVYFDIMGIGTENLVVYVKSNDLGTENYIKYAVFNVNYDNKTAQLAEPVNEADILKVNSQIGAE